MARAKKKNKDDPENLKTTIAEILTRILSPITSAVVGMLVIYFEYISSPGRSGAVWLISAGAVFALSVLTLFIFRKVGLISDWDITDRSQRPRFLAIVLLLFVMLLFITYQLGYLMAVSVLIFLISTIILASVITLFWKISFHTFSVTLCVLLIIVTFDPEYLLLLLILPVITAWTRVNLGKHTFIQTMGGIALGIATLWIWNLFPLIIG